MSYFKDDLLIFLLLHGPYYMKLNYEHHRVSILFYIILLFLERSLKNVVYAITNIHFSPMTLPDQPTDS